MYILKCICRENTSTTFYYYRHGVMVLGSSPDPGPRFVSMAMHDDATFLKRSKTIRTLPACFPWATPDQLFTKAKII